MTGLGERLDLADDLTIYLGDVREVLGQMPGESVHCVVTSPPYFGLRNYQTGQWEGGALDCRHTPPAWADDPGDLQNMGQEGALSANLAKWLKRIGGTCPTCGARYVDRQIGLESSVDDYVAALVEVFREVREVLRADGTLWLNLGDSYSGGGSFRPPTPEGLKPKDLLGIPWRVAIALQADGWYLRSDIIWSKPNPMPESVTDRPTKSHEYLFLFSKRPAYYYDADAIREPHSEVSIQRTKPHRSPSGRAERSGAVDRAGAPHHALRLDQGLHPAGRNKRSVWEVATTPFPEAHFAVYPPALIEPCILAGTSPKNCPTCATPWKRVVDKTSIPGGAKRDHIDRGDDRRGRKTGGANGCGYVHTETTGWAPTCSCRANDGSGKAIVLDPFLGSGTTALVALETGRAAVGVELNPQYVAIAKRRLSLAQRPIVLDDTQLVKFEPDPAADSEPEQATLFGLMNDDEGA